MSSNDAKFYNHLAETHRSYQAYTGWSIKKPRNLPDLIFKRRLIQIADKNEIALDIGCADGVFTIEIAPYFKIIIAVDLSVEMIKIATQKQAEQQMKNVQFRVEDATNLCLKDASVDIVYSRRGPTNSKEIARVLKSGGTFLGIGIGEKDAVNLKEHLRKIQGYRKWNYSFLDRSISFSTEAGLKVIKAKSYKYDQLFPNLKSLQEYLIMRPIIDNFDPETDLPLLESYAKNNTVDGQIVLGRHRIIIEASKI